MRGVNTMVLIVIVLVAIGIGVYLYRGSSGPQEGLREGFVDATSEVYMISVDGALLRTAEDINYILPQIAPNTTLATVAQVSAATSLPSPLRLNPAAPGPVANTSAGLNVLSMSATNTLTAIPLAANATFTAFFVFGIKPLKSAFTGANRPQIVSRINEIIIPTVFDADSTITPPRYYLYLNADNTDTGRLAQLVGTSTPAPPATPVGSSSSSMRSIGSSSSSMRSMGSSSSSGSYMPAADRRATTEDLRNFQARIAAAIIVIQSDGATDDVSAARIRNLQKIIQYIQLILDDVAAKRTAENNIPIMKSQIDRTLIALTNKSALPDIFSGTQLDSFIKGLLPDNLDLDPEVTQSIAEYIKSMTTNLSWSFGVNYTSDAERDIAQYYNAAASQGGDDGALTNLNLARAGTGLEVQPGGVGRNTQVTDEFANTPQEACRGPAKFDWKKRSHEICRALKARGERVDDYGCMPENVQVGANFSYRGYSRMVCERVAANYDTGLGGLVGCPPLDWAGWRK
jgi:hypothetical protein